MKLIDGYKFYDAGEGKRRHIKHDTRIYSLCLLGITRGPLARSDIPVEEICKTCLMIYEKRKVKDERAGTFGE